jgi:hypothetical protein
MKIKHSKEKNERPMTAEGRRRLDRPPRTRIVAGIQSGFAQKVDHENPRSSDINSPFEFPGILT